MNKLIVRTLIFAFAIYFISIIVFAWRGEVFNSDLFLLALEYCFYILVKSQGKYNCKWARFLALNVFATELFTYVDSLFNIVPDVEIFLYIVSLMWVIAIIATTYLGIKHFIRVRKLKRNE